MALIHEKLYQSESLAEIDLSEYIQTLTANLLHSYGVNEKVICPKIYVENIMLDVNTVIPCALIINELVSNSLRHAFPSSWRRAGGIGEICIDLCYDTGNQLKLTVSDNGIGLPEDFSIQNSESLGLKLVNVLVRQLKGTIHLNTSGKTQFAIAFPASRK